MGMLNYIYLYDFRIASATCHGPAGSQPTLPQEKAPSREGAFNLSNDKRR